MSPEFVYTFKQAKCLRHKETTMQSLRLHPSNQSKIEAAIAAVAATRGEQCGALDATYEQLQAAADEAEHHLEMRGLLPSSRVGARYEVIDKAGCNGRGFDLRLQTACHIDLERRSLGWYVAGVRRVVKQHGGDAGILWLTFEQGAQLKKRLLGRGGVA